MSAAEGGLESVIGQPRAVSALKSLLEGGHGIPPLLLEGPEGVGKRTAALAFAAHLVCRQSGRKSPCGRCSGCQRVAGSPAVADLRSRSTSQDSPMSYPDIGLISVPAGKTRISVLQARDIELSLSVQPFELDRRVYIIDPADRLTPAAANSLLKVLEEPPPFGVLVLITSFPWALPLTVRSRLRRLRFGSLSEEAVEAVLLRLGESEDQARLRAGRARGSLSRALSVEPEEEGRIVEGWIEVCEKLASGARPGALAVEAGERFAEDGSRTRRVLDLFVMVLRDAIAAGAGAPPELLDEQQVQRLGPYLAQRGGEVLETASEVDLLRSQMEIFHRNPKLSVEGAVLSAAGVLSLMGQ